MYTEIFLTQIWVIIDRLTKSAHFPPVKKTYPIHRLARLYVDEIVRLQGVPANIVPDRDPRFTSQFWEAWQEVIGTQLTFSTTFYPQIDWQSKRTIQTLEDMLCACVLNFYGSWDKHLSLVSLPTTIAINLPLGWHLLKLYMGTMSIATMLVRSGRSSITRNRIGGADIREDRTDSGENEGSLGSSEELRESTAARFGVRRG